MKKLIFIHIIVTIVIFLFSSYISKLILSGNTTVYKTGMQLFLELILALAAIKYFKLNFQLKIPSFKTGLKVFFSGFLMVIFLMFFINIISTLLGHVPSKEAHLLMEQMSVFQVFYLVFIGASIAEEFLFRGYLLNALKTGNIKQIKIFNIEISGAILISALLFSMAHLSLLLVGSGFEFVFKILLMTFILGLLAGYYQEKYQNTAYAILVHMGANLTGLIGMLLMQILAS